MSVLTVALEPPVRRTASAALWAFATVAIALGAARAVTTTYVPVLLERIADRPGLIGAVMLVNAAAGFVVPLITGLWSDRRGSRGPFIVGGVVVAGGGLVAIALGTASSYAVLALAAATVYIGLNAASTAHRALVAERFAADRRAAATGAQEGAMLVGALAGTLAGGALIDGSAAQRCSRSWALALPLLALPTLAWNRAAAPVAAPADAEGTARRCASWPRSCAATARGRSSPRRCCGSAPTRRWRRSWCSTRRRCSSCARPPRAPCSPASASSRASACWSARACPPSTCGAPCWPGWRCSAAGCSPRRPRPTWRRAWCRSRPPRSAPAS